MSNYKQAYPRLLILMVTVFLLGNTFGQTRSLVSVDEYFPRQLSGHSYKLDDLNPHCNVTVSNSKAFPSSVDIVYFPSEGAQSSAKLNILDEGNIIHSIKFENTRDVDISTGITKQQTLVFSGLIHIGKKIFLIGDGTVNEHTFKITRIEPAPVTIAIEKQHILHEYSSTYPYEESTRFISENLCHYTRQYD